MGKVRVVLEWPQATTLKELQRFLGFANFYRYFIRNIRHCQVCSTQKSSHQLSAGLLHPLSILQRSWSHIAIDLPVSEGNTTILTVVDWFSKACRLILLTKFPTALQTAEHLCNLVFRFYGLPEDIVYDRGPQF